MLRCQCRVLNEGTTEFLFCLFRSTPNTAHRERDELGLRALRRCFGFQHFLRQAPASQAVRGPAIAPHAASSCDSLAESVSAMSSALSAAPVPLVDLSAALRDDDEATRLAALAELERRASMFAGGAWCSTSWVASASAGSAIVVASASAGSAIVEAPTSNGLQSWRLRHRSGLPSWRLRVRRQSSPHRCHRPLFVWTCPRRLLVFRTGCGGCPPKASAS